MHLCGLVNAGQNTAVDAFFVQVGERRSDHTYLQWMHLCRLVNAGQTIHTAVDALVQVGERRSDHTYRSGCTCAGW